MRKSMLLALLAVVSASSALAAEPPALLNYQGVLRDASDRPLSGGYDVTCRFFNAASGGVEIIVDRHTAANGGQVTASGGLFSVQLGGGSLVDGSGAGTYTGLAAVFRDYEPVWVELEIGAEILAPRVRVVSTGYALNSDFLDGKTSTDFANGAHQHAGSDITSAVANANALGGQAASFYLNTSSAPQTKTGELTVSNSTAGQTAIHATGTVSALGIGRFENGAADGDAIQGLNFAASGSGTGRGVVGQTAQATGVGVQGGNTNANGTGVIGSGNNQSPSYLTAGSGGAFTGLATGLFAYAPTAGVGQALYTNLFGSIVRVNYWSGTTQFKILGTGTVSSVVSDLEGAPVVVHAPEAPEILLMDFGAGRLDKGFAHVELDPVFARNVVSSAAHPLRAFVQLEDDDKSAGVVVRNKTATGFDVVELGGGRSSAPFQWQVVCNRADEVLAHGRKSLNADMRFERAPSDIEMISPGSGALSEDGHRADAASVSRSRPSEPGGGSPLPKSEPVARVPSPESASIALLPPDGAMEPGDLVVIDKERPGFVRRAATSGDPAVIGVVSGELVEVDGALLAPVAGAGFALMKVDADHGAILPGDLLTASPTPGHAMRAPVPPVSGTVIGKAVEALPQGQGRIKVLLVAR